MTQVISSLALYDDDDDDDDEDGDDVMMMMMVMLVIMMVMVMVMLMMMTMMITGYESLYVCLLLAIVIPPLPLLIFEKMSWFCKLSSL